MMQLFQVCSRVPLDEVVCARLEEAVFEGEGARFEANVVVLGDEQIRRVNREALRHDFETDVVAFDLRDPTVHEAGPDAEIYVNAEMAQREALARGCRPEVELLFYVAHGLLHLLGYDDRTEEERRSMHRLQRRYLVDAGIEAPPL